MTRVGFEPTPLTRCEDVPCFREREDKNLLSRTPWTARPSCLINAGYAPFSTHSPEPSQTLINNPQKRIEQEKDDDKSGTRTHASFESRIMELFSDSHLNGQVYYLVKLVA